MPRQRCCGSSPDMCIYLCSRLLFKKCLRNVQVCNIIDTRLKYHDEVICGVRHQCVRSHSRPHVLLSLMTTSSDVKTILPCRPGSLRVRHRTHKPGVKAWIPAGVVHTSLRGSSSIAEFIEKCMDVFTLEKMTIYVYRLGAYLHVLRALINKANRFPKPETANSKPGERHFYLRAGLKICHWVHRKRFRPYLLTCVLCQ